MYFGFHHFYWETSNRSSPCCFEVNASFFPELFYISFSMLSNFKNMTVMGLVVVLLLFILLEFLRSYWICWLIFFTNWKKFLPIFPSNIVCAPFSLLSLSGNSISSLLQLLILFHKHPMILSIFFHVFSHCISVCIFSMYLTPCWQSPFTFQKTNLVFYYIQSAIKTLLI